MRCWDHKNSKCGQITWHRYPCHKIIGKLVECAKQLLYHAPKRSLKFGARQAQYP